MKKRFIFFIFLLGFLLVPHETFAKTDSFTGNGSYFFGGPYNKSNKVGTTWDYQQNGSFPTSSSINFYYSSSTQYYALKQIGLVNSSFAFKKDMQYTIRIYFRMSKQIVPNAFGNGFDDYCNILQNAQIQSCSWDSGTTSDYFYYTHTLVIVPNSDFTGLTIDLGYADNAGTTLFINTSSTNDQVFVLYDSSITYAASDNQDSQAIIDANNANTQQIITNNNNNTNSINNNINETNNKLDSIGDDLVDDTAPSSQDYNDFIDDLPVVSFGPISGALQMPIKILNNMVIRVNSSCTSINFGSLLGTSLVIPCFSPYDYLDASTTYGDLYTFIGAVFAIFIYYQTAMIVVNHWDKWTSFDDGFNSLYQPKHANNGYKPKHGGGD